MILVNTFDTTREEKSKIKNLFLFKKKIIYLNKNSVIEQLDAKTTIMSMLSHEDTNVKHQALLCIQKLMVHHW